MEKPQKESLDVKKDVETNENIVKEKDKSSRSNIYKVIAIVSLLFLVAITGLMSYLYFTGKVELVQEEEKQSEENSNVVEEDEEEISEFEETLTTKIGEGEEYVFFAYSEEIPEDTQDINFTVFNLTTKEPVLNKVVTVKLDELEQFNFNNVFLNMESGEIYFSTSITTVDTGIPYDCAGVDDFPVETCKMKIFKTSFLTDEITEIFSSEGKIIWEADFSGDRLLIKSFDLDEEEIQYKELALDGGETTYLATMLQVEEGVNILTSGNKLYYLGDKAYDIVSVYSPDVLHQNIYIRILDLNTRELSEERIPGITADALTTYSISADRSKLVITYSEYEESNNIDVDVVIYDINDSQILADTQDLSHSIENFYTPISNNGSLYFRSDDRLTYVFDYSEGSSESLITGTPRFLSANQNYLILDSNTAETVFIYDLENDEYFSIKEYYPRFLEDLDGMADYSFLFGEM